MNRATVAACWQRLTDTPGAADKLRQFILELAVRGKLVPQDKSDTPVNELIRRLRTGKERLVDSGQLRRPREFESPAPEAPFPIPGSWQWVRLDLVGAIVGGGTPASENEDHFTSPGEGIPWLTPADLGGRTALYIQRGARDLTPVGLKDSSATLMPTGTVLFTSRAPIGYVAIASNPVATNQGFKSIVPYVGECSRFIAAAMKAFAPSIDAAAPATTFKEVSGKIVAGLPFPLPPLEEQKRIVDRVDELFALCEQFEAARRTRERNRDALSRATFNGLFDLKNAGDLSPWIRSLLTSLSAILTKPGSSKQLRGVIHDFAVRGMLVPQNSADEPATEALARIAAERSLLVEAKQIRRERPLRPIKPEDTPYETPDGWRWERIGNIVLFTQYGTSRKAEKTEVGAPVLAMGNIQDGIVKANSPKRIPLTAEELPDLYLQRYDLLYNRTNSAELVGKTGIFLGDDGAFTFASYLIRLRPSLASSDPRYLNVAMNAPVFRRTQVVPLIKKQTGQANVNGTALRNMLIPFPPLEEQRRIVRMVDVLLELCERLEGLFLRVQESRVRLLEAVIRTLLTDTTEERGDANALDRESLNVLEGKRVSGAIV